MDGIDGMPGSLSGHADPRHPHRSTRVRCFMPKAWFIGILTLLIEIRTEPARREGPDRNERNERRGRILGAVPSSPDGNGSIGESGARPLRACAGTPPPGTEVNGRAARVHDFLGLRLASARKARGAPAHVPSGALPAARAPSLTAAGSALWPGGGIAVLATRYEKTSRNYLALVQIGCAWLCLG